MFVGREDIVTDICKRHEQSASQSHSRVAFVGLGGVGKVVVYNMRFERRLSEF